MLFRNTITKDKLAPNVMLILTCSMMQEEPYGANDVLISVKLASQKRSVLHA